MSKDLLQQTVKKKKKEVYSSIKARIKGNMSEQNEKKSCV
jgi:hypothetical protein